MLGLSVADARVAAYVQAHEPGWHVAISPDGSRTAILTEESLEVYRLDLKFSDPVFSCRLRLDLNPAWGCLHWDAATNLIAAATSLGDLVVLAPDGHQWATPPAIDVHAGTGSPQPAATAVAAVAMVSEPRQLLVLGFACSLQVYNLLPASRSPLTAIEPPVDLRAQFSCTAAMAYSSRHRLVVLGGAPRRSAGPNLACWRLISEAPFLQPFEVAGLVGTGSAAVRQLSCSADGTRLVALDTDNCVTVFMLPSLRVLTVWEYSAMQSAFVSSTRMQMPDPLLHHLHQVVWWHNDALLLTHANGAVIVSALDRFQNILGR